MRKLIFTLIFLLFLTGGATAHAAQLGSRIPFIIDSEFDLQERKELTAELVLITPQLYFYVDTIWWDAKRGTRKNEVTTAFQKAAAEFERNTYPNITSAFGSEWRPGIDGDPRITILMHPLKDGSGGYFRTADGYLKLQVPESNEREMLYMSTDFIDHSILKSFIAHEFVHLITFNQKDRLRGVSDDVWLNEARAEYSSTFLGYNDPFKDSNLELRVDAFLRNPSDAITEWSGEQPDYASVSLFIHYLMDHYGVQVLIDSLHSDKTGIASIIEGLEKGGNKKTFEEIFTDWTIATLLNDCSYGPTYCYLNTRLKNLKIVPNTNFLPFSARSTLSITKVAANWEGSWERFTGGLGVLKFEFEGQKGLKYRVPYVVQHANGTSTIDFLALDSNNRQTIFIPAFGSENKAFIALPSLQSKFTGFQGKEIAYPYSLTASIVERTPAEEDQLIQTLLWQVAELQKEVVRLQTLLLAAREERTCSEFIQDLFVGTGSANDVTCLQQALKNEGPEVYPEGLVTGNFLALTEQAVIRFQEKYADEVLAPIGLTRGTGYVGRLTRDKLNALIL